MEPASPLPSTRLARWHRFLRWFFNSSPTAMIESHEPPRASRGSLSRADKAGRGRPHQHERRRWQAMHRFVARRAGRRR
jgi:hypothetical protein